MRLKQLLFGALGLCAFLFAVDADAQKVTERSRKNRPEWIGGTQKEYLIVSARGKDLESAKQKCLAAVKVQMLESVAQNIEYSTETLVEQFTHNEEVESNISFRQKGKTSVVNLPYISGISLANAEDSYWEKVADETDCYIFHLLYPYSTSDYRTLKEEFDKLDAEMDNLVRKHENTIADIRSVEEIESGIEALFIAQEYFFDAKRRAWTGHVMERYRQLFARLAVESECVGKCRFRCWITLDGNVLKSSVIPVMKAACASRLQCTTDGETYIVSFSDEDCIEDEPNYINLTFRWKEYTLKHKLHF